MRGQSINLDWEAQEEAAAAAEAAAIGGRAGDEYLDPAERPLVEAGGGVAEGFELAEEALVEAAEYGGEWANPLASRFRPETDRTHARATYGEADHEASSEAVDGEW